MTRYDNLLASVGGTPLIGLPTLSPTADVVPSPTSGRAGSA